MQGGIRNKWKDEELIELQKQLRNLTFESKSKYEVKQESDEKVNN